MSHTPGPWKCRSLVGMQVRGDATTYEVGSLDADMSISHAPANARLIAAAPELLSALKAFVDRYPNNVGAHDARKAIAKAEGR